MKHDQSFVLVCIFNKGWKWRDDFGEMAFSYQPFTLVTSTEGMENSTKSVDMAVDETESGLSIVSLTYFVHIVKESPFNRHQT